VSHAPLSREDRHALAHWGLGTVLYAATPAAGTVNRTALIQTSEGSFALRVSRREQERVEWEHECIAWAADHGLPVCRPIPLPWGATVEAHAGTFYALFPLAHGRQVMRGDLDAEHARAAGECLARIHAAFETFPSERARPKRLTVDVSGARSLIPRVEEAIRVLPNRGEAEETALQHMAERRARLAPLGHLVERATALLATLPAVVVHGDYQETNLFFEGDAVSAVIDWDQSGLAPRGWEVMRALHLMLGLAPNLCHPFLSGYRSVLPLPEEELADAAMCYGVLADSNLWVYKAAYLDGNGRAKRFIGSEPFVPFQEQWEAAGLEGKRLIATVGVVPPIDGRE
jgi:homoserine kinase type II